MAVGELDPREGPQQGTSSAAEQDPGGIWGDGGQWGTATPADQDPGGIWGDGPRAFADSTETGGDDGSFIDTLIDFLSNLF
ncbi:hypothetical protein ACN268_00275 [Micromonospora sp. WMMD735]|uniref:hypothetical protein n=1 Tax=Micromonospora sp. WMMD735 TaxID=3404130 RepID=UPI003B94318C